MPRAMRRFDVPDMPNPPDAPDNDGETVPMDRRALLQREIDALQDKLLLEGLHPEEEKRLEMLRKKQATRERKRPKTKLEEHEQMPMNRREFVQKEIDDLQNKLLMEGSLHPDEEKRLNLLVKKRETLDKAASKPPKPARELGLKALDPRKALQDEIDILQDKLLLGGLEPEEEQHLNSLLEKRKAVDLKRQQAAPQRHNELEQMRMKAGQEERSGVERIKKVLAPEKKQFEGTRATFTEEEALAVNEQKAEQLMRAKQEEVKRAEKREDKLAREIEAEYGAHPAALEIKKTSVGSRIGRLWRGALAAMTGTQSRDEVLEMKLRDWRNLSARVESLREAAGQYDDTGIGAWRVERAKARQHHEQIEEEHGDIAAARTYRDEQDIMLPSGRREQDLERGFFEDQKAIVDIEDEETFRRERAKDIEHAQYVMMEAALTLQGKQVEQATGYARELWDTVEKRYRKRSTEAMEAAERAAGTKDVATAYVVALSQLAEEALKDQQNTLEPIEDLTASVEHARVMTLAEERVKSLNRILGWRDDFNIPTLEPAQTLKRGRRAA